MLMILKIVSALVLLVVAFMFYKNSTTPDYLGVQQGKFAPMPSTPNAVSSQTDIAEKKVASLPFDSVEQAKLTVTKVLQAMGNNSVESESDNYIHIIFTTDKMRYNDDVELFFDVQNQQLHYRSQSRVGYSDGGANLKRYQRFTKHYQALSE